MTTKNTTRPVYTVASKRLVIPAQEVKILGYDIAAATMVEVASTTSTATPVASFASISAIKTTTTTKSASFTAIPTESRYVIDTSGKTVTLQAADPVGTTYEIWDGSGDAANSVHTITVADGGHTINGGASITLGTNYGMLKITKTSSTAWHCGSGGVGTGGGGNPPPASGPVAQTATVAADGLSIDLFFDTGVNGDFNNGLPASSVFSITADNVAIPMDGGINVLSHTVQGVLTFYPQITFTTAILQGQTVLVSYTRPANSSGGDIVAFDFGTGLYGARAESTASPITATNNSTATQGGGGGKGK